MKVKLKRSSIINGYVEAIKSGSVIESDKPEAIAEFKALIAIGLAEETTEAVSIKNRVAPEAVADGREDVTTEDDEDLLAILAGTVGEVTESLDALDTDGLNRLLVLENKSEKPRKGVQEAIEAAVAALAE